MKIITKKQDLIKALNSVSRLTATRSTLPILQNVYIGAQSDELIIRATDLEQTIEGIISAEVQEEGVITIPLRLLLDFLQNNTDEIITLTSEDLSIKVKSTNHQIKLKGMNPQDYPTTQKISVDFNVDLDQQTLKRAIATCLFASANDDTRPILTGLLFKFTKNNLTIVGTDGYRLAKYEISKGGTEGQFIVPKKTLLELEKLLGDGNVKMSVGQSQIQFKINKVILISRLIDGTYPAFDAIIPKDKKVEVEGNGTALLNSLKVASLFSRDSAYSTSLKIKSGIMEIVAKSPQLGESKSEVAIENIGQSDFSTSLNSQYLIDALNALSGDFKLEFNTESSPIVMRFLDDINYLYLIMPLRSE